MIEEAVAALRQGRLVVLPTDTVYGLCADAYREAPCRLLCRVKRRPEEMPTALLAADFDAVLDAVPEARGRAAVAARALLPGPYTLVLPNPARPLPLARPGRGRRRSASASPRFRPPRARWWSSVGAVAATSANLHGGEEPASVADVPAEILERAVVLDAGALPGSPSTVVDLTGTGAARPARRGGLGGGGAGPRREALEESLTGRAVVYSPAGRWRSDD